MAESKHPGWFTNILLGIVGFFLSITFWFVVGIFQKTNQLLINEAAREERIKSIDARVTTTETRLENHLKAKSDVE